MSGIQIENLVKTYGDNIAVNGLNLNLEKGKVYGFLGPNGAGKSTTMNIITGYIGATSGTVKIDGYDIFKEPEKAKKCVGYLPEIPPLYQDMTVKEYLVFVAELKKIPAKEKMKNIKKIIAKKLGKHGGLTQYEEAYIENWILDFGYDMNVIEIALKRTTYKQNPTFEYINSVISDWHERNLKTPDQVEAFLEQRKKQTKDLKEMKSKVSKANYEQRQYDNLDFLYANNVTDNMDNNK